MKDMETRTRLTIVLASKPAPNEQENTDVGVLEELTNLTIIWITE